MADSTTISYDDIFSSFLGNITDYSLAKLSEEQANKLMTELLRKAKSTFYVKRMFKTINLDDGLGEITYKMKYPSDDSEDDKDFVITVLGKAMVYYWYDPKVHNTLLTNQMISDTDKKFYSQAQHFSTLSSAQENVKLEVRKLIKERQSEYNSYLIEGKHTAS